MRFPLFHSRNGLRFYLLRGIALSILLVLAVFAGNVWQVYRTGNQTLPAAATADAAVVLGAAAWNKQPSPVFLERINHAIALYQSHRVGKIVFTGGTPKKGYMTEAEVGRRYALKQGIPAKNILFENTSRNTYENLRNIKPILRANSVDSIIIVSDPYHLARAAAVADYVGLDYQTEPTPTSRYSGQNRAKFMASEVLSLMAFQWWRLSETVAAYGRDYLLSRQAGQ